jgi:DNA (cytosine-5)-methyltransferase 1
LEQHETSGSREGLTYNVVVHLANAADYGVPQKRERVFFVGFRGDRDIAWNFPKPTHTADALAWAQYRTGEYWDRHEVPWRSRALSESLRARAWRLEEKPKSRPWRTVRDAIADLPDPERKGRAPEIPNHRLQPGARSYTGHTGSPMDEPAKTLKAGVHGVPGGENMLLKPNGSVRYFTVRESARLQTFPDEYVFSGAWSEAMRQLGNAVPVTLAETVARSVSAHLLSKSGKGASR